MPENSHSFSSILVNFANNLDTLRDFVDLVAPVLEEARKKDIEADPAALVPALLAMNALDPDSAKIESSNLQKIKDSFNGEINLIVEDQEEGKKVSIAINGPDREKFYSCMENLRKRYQQNELLYQNSLISLVSAVEWFLSQIIHRHLELQPHSELIKDRSLKFSDLQAMGTIEDAKNYLVDLRIEEVLRGNFSSWIKFLKENLNLSMSYLADDNDYLVEICQRRNLFVHNGGKVNNIYLKMVPDTVRENYRIGETIRISQKYLDESIGRFERFLLLVALELWKKILPEDEERGDTIIHLSYENLLKERWGISKSLSLFLIQDKQLSESSRLIGQVNYWLSLKFQDDFKGARKEIEKADFSAKDEKFILAKAALLDKEEEVFEILSRLVESQRITLDEVQEWPLLEGIRKSERFTYFINKYLPK